MVGKARREIVLMKNYKIKRGDRVIDAAPQINDSYIQDNSNKTLSLIPNLQHIMHPKN